MLRLSQLARMSSLSFPGHSHRRDVKITSQWSYSNAMHVSGQTSLTFPRPNREFSTAQDKKVKNTKNSTSKRVQIEYNDNVPNTRAPSIIHRSSPTSTASPAKTQDQESLQDFIKRLRSNKYLRFAQITSLLYLFYLGYDMYQDVQSSAPEDKLYKEKKYALKFFSSFGLSNTEWFQSRWAFTPEEQMRYNLEKDIESSSDPAAAAALDGRPLSKDGVILVPKEVTTLQAYFPKESFPVTLPETAPGKDVITKENSEQDVALGTATTTSISPVGVFGEKRLRNDVNAFSEQDKHNSQHGGPIRYHTHTEYPTKLSNDTEDNARVFTFKTKEERDFLESESNALFRELSEKFPSTPTTGKDGNPIAITLTANPISESLSHVFAPPHQHLTPQTRTEYQQTIHSSVCALSGNCCCNAWFLKENSVDNVLAISPSSLQDRFNYQFPPTLFSSLSTNTQHTLSTLPILLHPYFLSLPLEPHFPAYLQGLSMYGKGETLPFTQYPMSLTPYENEEPSMFGKMKDFAFVQRVRNFRLAMKKVLAQKDSMTASDIQECERLNKKHFGLRPVDKIIGAVTGSSLSSMEENKTALADELMNAPFGLPVGIYRDPETGNSRVVKNVPVPDATGKYHLHMHNPYEPSQELHVPEYSLKEKKIRIPEGFPDNQFVVQSMNTEVRLPLHDNLVMNALLLRSVQGLALLNNFTSEQKNLLHDYDYYAETGSTNTLTTNPSGNPPSGNLLSGTATSAPAALKSMYSLFSVNEENKGNNLTTNNLTTNTDSSSGTNSSSSSIVSRIETYIQELKNSSFLSDLQNSMQGVGKKVNDPENGFSSLQTKITNLSSTFRNFISGSGFPSSGTTNIPSLGNANVSATDAMAAQSEEDKAMAKELQNLFKYDGENAEVINNGVMVAKVGNFNNSDTIVTIDDDVEVKKLQQALTTVFDTHNSTDGSLQYFMLGNGLLMNTNGDRFSSLDDVPVHHIPLLPFALRVLRDPTATHWEPSPITGYDRFKWVFNTCVLPLAPLRLTLSAACLLGVWFFARLSLIGLDTSKANGYGMATPRAKWRHAMLQPACWLTRLFLFINGFYRIRKLGRCAHPTEAPVVVANHVSIVDAPLMFYVDGMCPMFIAKAGVLKLPLFKDIMLANGSILLDRASSTSRSDVQREINRRALHNLTCGPDDLHYPHIAIFPEGTTTSGHALIDFKLGAFRAGVPVQPMVLRYPHQYFNPSYAGADKTGLVLASRLLTQFYSSAEIEFLPVYRPSEMEKQDPQLFARNVRKRMAVALAVPTVDMMAY